MMFMSWLHHVSNLWSCWSILAHFFILLVHYCDVVHVAGSIMSVTYGFVDRFLPTFVFYCDCVHDAGSIMSVTHYHVDRLLPTFLFRCSFSSDVVHAAGSIMSVTRILISILMIVYPVALLRATLLQQMAPLQQWLGILLIKSSLFYTLACDATGHFFRLFPFTWRLCEVAKLASWLLAFLFRNVCVLCLMFDLDSWLLLWVVISFGCVLNFHLVKGWWWRRFLF